MNSDFFIGVGHPRCGTGFSSNLLSASGLDVGHEKIKENGIVSWCLAGETEQVPWGDSFGIIPRYANLFCVTRSPLLALPSICPELSKRRSYTYIRQVVNGRFGNEPLPDISVEAFKRAVLSYSYWYKICISLVPDIVFKVDHPEDRDLLSRYAGVTLVSNDVPRNHKKKRVKPTLGDEDYASLQNEELELLCEICEKLGYEKEKFYFEGFLKR